MNQIYSDDDVLRWVRAQRRRDGRADCRAVRRAIHYVRATVWRVMQHDLRYSGEPRDVVLAGYGQ